MGAVLYPGVTGYAAASGQDTRTFQVDPQFVNPSRGDFHLLEGSPAIDNANSSVPGWPTMDAEGHPRADDPSVPNAGIGPVPYADRGALEFTPTDGGLIRPGTPLPLLTAAPTPAEETPAATPAAVAPQVFPNPLRGPGRIVFSTSKAGSVSVKVLDLGGRLVRKVLDESAWQPGLHTVSLDGRGDDGHPLRPGIYLFEIVSEQGVRAGRFAVMR
jgi:hypothetical protein